MLSSPGPSASLGTAIPNDKVYGASGGGNVSMSANSLATTGGSLPHNNMPPYLTLNFIIATQGVFPPRP